MDIITNRQSNPSSAIEYNEVYIPDKGNLGTGKFITRIKSKVLLTEKFVLANILLIPHFQLSVNLNPATSEVPILLGHADGTSPLSRKIFLLPQTIDHNISHDFIVEFENWNIISFMMDKILLEEKQTGEIQKTAFDQKEPSTVTSNVKRLEFFRQLTTLLEKIMPDGWFTNPKNQGHPAFQRWAFCQRIIAQHGILKFPEQETELPLFGQFLLDAQCLKLIIDQQYLDKLIKQAKTKIFNYLAHTSQFDDIMLEISVTAWHLMKNHNAEILEISNYPDVKLDIPSLALPIYAECKNITVDNDERINTEIKNANRQLKKVSEPHYGVVVLNIAKPIKLQQVNSDTYPEKVYEIIKLVKKRLSGKQHRSVGAAIVIWDDFIQLGEIPSMLLFAYRRRFVRIDHTEEEECMEIPQHAALFSGMMSEFTINSPR